METFITFCVLYAGLAGAGYVLRWRFITYEFSITFLFFLSILYYKNLDLSFPMYFVATCIPLGVTAASLCLREKVYVFERIYFFVWIFYMVYSVAVAGFRASISVILVKYAGLLLYPLLYAFIRRNETECDRKKLRKLMLAATIMEVILAFGAGDARVTMNYQCINGGIATAMILPVSYLNSRRDESCLIDKICLIVLVACTLYSATRGYMMIVIPIALLTILFYWKKVYVVLLGMMTALVALVFCLFQGEAAYQAVQLFLRVTRIEESGGYRNIENMLAFDIISKQSAVKTFLGNGFGYAVGNMQNAKLFLYNMNIDKWLINRTVQALSLHNQWVNLLLEGGILMAGMTITLFGRLLRQIHIKFRNHKMRMIMAAYMLLFIACNYYRYTATAGILEWTAFIYVFSWMLLDQKKDQEIGEKE